MGVRYTVRKPGYAPRWTEDRVRAELAEFVGGRDAWPARREFEVAGRKPLRDAVTRLGGIERWADEFDLAIPGLRAGSRRRWDEKRIETAVRPLVEHLGRWPTRAEFEEAGIGGALTAMYSHAEYGGIDAWRQRFRVSPPPPGPKRTIWSDERIERELRSFCRGRKTWPGAREFEIAGLGRLYRGASLHGGIPRWRSIIGLEPDPQARRRRGTSAPSATT
jgi:hypothetical protein